MKVWYQTIPIEVTTLEGATLVLYPVAMNIQFPSKSDDAELWGRFSKNTVIGHVSFSNRERIQKYMNRKGSEALSQDGKTAYTLQGEALVLCDPAVCGQA